MSLSNFVGEVTLWLVSAILLSQLQYLMQSNGNDRRIKISNSLFPIIFFDPIVYLNPLLNNVLVPSVIYFSVQFLAQIVQYSHTLFLFNLFKYS
jgi:hypothetical protein